MATIEIDGKKVEVENGKTIIEVADDMGVYIPRFCYHKKLSVAANCRMCLVEVENGRKPVPACATPITDGMKVFTKSEEALRSQKAVMEFLLINHPLDCPICDQGGECELQDISMGFGHDESEYTESKRSVDDDDLGSLISTEMTRCIHCTRCVRFGDEVAGYRELGATGRGEHMQIGTYIKHSIASEVSGNVIDLCPVGALTSKPYRFSARSWEMTQHDSIAPHDCLGSNVHLHVRRNQLMRAVPRENESINETWLSDRDRFSYLGMTHPNRALKPMVRKNGVLEPVEWEEALTVAASGMTNIIKQHGAEQVAALAHPSSTLEEHYLLQKWMRSLGVNNLDHRIHQIDFSDQSYKPIMQTNHLPYEELEKQTNILIVGANLVKEVPLAGIRVRKAVNAGAKVAVINPMDYDFHFKVAHRSIVNPYELTFVLARILLSLVHDVNVLPNELQKFLVGIKTDEFSNEVAKMLRDESASIVSGQIFENHPDAALLRTLVYFIEKYSAAKHIHFSFGANSAGAEVAGMLPHRTLAGRTVNDIGLNIQQAISEQLKGYWLHGVEPSFDIANTWLAHKSMLAAEFVVMTSAYYDDAMNDYVDVLLPMAPYSETSGTYVNIDQKWQTFKGSMKPLGESRPAWKIYRVLGNLTHSDGFDYVSSDEILDEIHTGYSMASPLEVKPFIPELLPEHETSFQRIGEWPMFRVDAISRHSNALQNSAAAEKACIRVHPDTAEKLKLDEQATVSQGDIEITLPLKRDRRVAKDSVYVANGLLETVDLQHAFAPIIIKR